MFNSQIAVLNKSEIQLYLLLLVFRSRGNSDGTHLVAGQKPNSKELPYQDRWATWLLLQVRAW